MPSAMNGPLSGDFLVLDLRDRQHLLHVDAGQLLDRLGVRVRVDAAADEQVAEHLGAAGFLVIS